MSNSLIAKSRFILFISLIICTPLSKYPSFALPVANFPSFRIGLYQLLAIIFILLCLPPLIKQKSMFMAPPNILVSTILLLFTILVGTSIAWSNYPTRSTLLAGSIAILVALVFSAWWYVPTTITKEHIKIIIKTVLTFGIIYTIIGIIQYIIGTFSSSNDVLLCTGCNANVFGFARVNGFTAEPQFFANAMLPFFFIALYSTIKKASKLGWISLTAVSLTIGLTFSRGAYFALAISLAVTLVLFTHKKLIKTTQIAKIITLVGGSFIIAFIILIAGASIKNSSTPDITYKTIDTMAEHISLGVINLPDKITSPPPATQNTGTNFVSPGLIEASSTERTSAASLAIKAWHYSPLSIVFGVGIGNLGPFVTKYIDSSAPNTLTVYIYYILLLSELGIVGLLLFVSLFIICFKKLLDGKTALSISLFGLLLAFFIQYLFFGSYINVMYIWLWLGISLGVTPLVSKAKLKHTVKEGKTH